MEASGWELLQWKKNHSESHPFMLKQCKPSLALIQRISVKSCGFSLSRFPPNLLHPSPFSASRRFFTVSPSFPELVLALVSLIPAFGVFLHFRYTRKVPYTHRKRYMNFSESVTRKMEEEFLEEIIKERSKGKILPATHPQSVKVCSILKNLLDVLHSDLGLLQVPIITYYHHTDVIRPIRKSIFDMSFRQVRSRINGWRTDIKHLKGLNWLVVVMVTPRYTAFSLGGGIIAVSSGFLNANCDLGITAVIAHEVGHCVARHSTEIIDFSLTRSPLHTYGKQSITVNMRRRAEIEADYIGLLLMASAGFDPSVILQFYVKTEARYRHVENPNAAISMKERVRILSNPLVMEKAFNIYMQTKSSDLKVDLDIRQHVDIVSENQKYSK